MQAGAASGGMDWMHEMCFWHPTQPMWSFAYQEAQAQQAIRDEVCAAISHRPA